MNKLLKNFGPALFIIKDLDGNGKLDILIKYNMLMSVYYDKVNTEWVKYVHKNYEVLLNKVVYEAVINNLGYNKFKEQEYINKAIAALVAKNQVTANASDHFEKIYSMLSKKFEEYGYTIKDDIDVDDIKEAINTFNNNLENKLGDTLEKHTPEPETEVIGDESDFLTEEEYERLKQEGEIDEYNNIESADNVDIDSIFNDNELESMFNIDEESEELDKENTTEETDETQQENLEKEAEEAEELAEAERKRLEEEERREEERKESLRTGDISGKAEDIVNQKVVSEEVDEELSYFVDTITNNITKVYAKVYQPLFCNPPSGVLYTDENGKNQIMCVGKSGEAEGVKVHNIPKLRLFVSNIYKSINDTFKATREAPKVGAAGMDMKLEWMNRDGTMKYNYAPHIQVRNCCGVYRDKQGKLKRAKTWQEFQSKLIKELKPTILALLKQVDINDEAIIKRAVNSIQEFYTNIYLVNEFDTEKALRMTIVNSTITGKGKGVEIVDSIVRGNFLNQSLDAYKVVNNTVENGIVEFLVVTDMVKYQGEINFLYKTMGRLLQAGGNISMNNAIIGTDISGNPYGINLLEDALTSMAIVAGSRSGKGVLTLAILASILGSGYPMVYLDYKPDMAGVFWQMERQEEGSKILAIDGQTNMLGLDSSGKTLKEDEGISFKARGLKPVRYYEAGNGCPSEVYSQLLSALAVIPYIKGIQLMNFIGKARVMGMLPKNKKMFFILDEAERCGDAIADGLKTINELASKHKPAKGKESETYDYLCALTELYRDTWPTVTAFNQTNAGSGNMAAIILGQQPAVSAWEKGPFSSLMKRAYIRLLGNGTSGGQYGLSSKTKGADLLGRGYFGLYPSGQTIAEKGVMLKTALVLNDADYDPSTGKGDKYTGSVLKNISNDDIREDVKNNDFTVSEKNTVALNAGFELGSANPLVGFPGLIKYIGSLQGENFRLADVLSSGYREAEKILSAIGIVGENCPFPNVEAYLYSAAPNSLFTSGELVTALKNNKTVYDIKENGIPVEKIADGDSAEGEGEETNGTILNMGALSEDEDSTTNNDNGSSNEDSFFDTNLNNSESIDNDTEFIENAQFDLNRVETGNNVKIENLKFCTTIKLIEQNLSRKSLEDYHKKYIESKVLNNNYNYKDRDKKSLTGLRMACMVFSTSHYCSAMGAYTIYTLKQALVNKINCGQDKDNRCKIALGLLQAYDQKQLQYDVMPDEQTMIQWIQMLSPQSQNISDEMNFNDDMLGEINFNDAMSGGMNSNDDMLGEMNFNDNTSGGMNFNDDMSGGMNFNDDMPGGIDFTKHEQTTNNQDLQGNMLNNVMNEFSVNQVPQQYRAGQSLNQVMMQQYREPEHMEYVNNPSYTVDTQGRIIITPRGTQDVYEFTAHMIKNAVEPQYGVSDKLKKFLFESRNGTSYQFKVYWDYILKLITDAYPNINAISAIKITGQQIIINNSSQNSDNIINLAPILGGKYNIQLEHIINFRALFKKFPRLITLEVDANFSKSFILEYGPDAKSLWKAFQENRNLQRIGFIPRGGGQPTYYDRHTFKNTASNLNRDLSEENTRMMIEEICARRNPNLREKAPGYMQDIYKAGKAKSKDSFTNAKQRFDDKDKRVGKALGYSLLGATAILFTGPIGLLGTALGFLNKRRWTE